jgi:predicted peptidase
MDFFKKYLKWISTAFVLSGILLTNLNYYPLNIFLHGMGALGWTLAGYLNQDRALMVNFGIQIPLFALGYIKLFF